MSTLPDRPAWWHRAVLYQVYPRSFQDSDGDGTGDLQGIRARLDYLRWLGVDAVWLSPIFRSPMADFGYDVADYTDIDPLFGTLADYDALVADAHARDMRLLLDFVPNHTSDQHPWFIASRSSRDDPKRDWYIWRDPAPDGGPPNGWRAAFGGSAWELDTVTGQYYFHSFLPQQPDLDWTNPALRDQMHDVLRFWFRRGADGFRIDVVNLLAKRRELLPGPVGRRQVWGDPRRIHPILRGLRAVADEFDGVLVGETWLPPRTLVTYYGRKLDELQLPFNFQLLTLPWRADAIEVATARYDALLPPGAWPSWVLGNHDRPRIATRVGQAQARVAAVLLLTLRGTPTLYYGDELGMADVDVPRDRRRDPQGLRGGVSRDPARTPMRWDGSAGAGFSSGEPWLPLGDDANRLNVEAARGDPDSMLSLHRRLLALRRAEPALSLGSFESLGARGGALAYLRAHAGRSFLVALNLSAARARIDAGRAGRIRVATDVAREGQRAGPTVELAADEAVVVELD